MLYLHFINVGDGDAVLIEEREGGRIFRLLVDTGRPEVGAFPGSRRLTAAAYLKKRGITRLDALVVTHLHIDHFGGLSRLLEEVEIGTVYSGFFPCPPAGRAVRTGTEEKTVSGLLDCLNQWAADTEALAAGGCRLCQVEETQTLALTPRLRADILCPDPDAAARQRRVWSALLARDAVDGDQVWWSSKYRNPGSLRLTLYYAGRRVELAGDCYGAVWAEQAAPCGLLKVPHHGDAKAVTEPLVKNLRPEHAVISCSAEYIPRKDRPSEKAAALLEAQGARVWYTDRVRRPGRHPADWEAAVFTVTEAGDILPPAQENESSLQKREGAGRSI